MYNSFVCNITIKYIGNASYEVKLEVKLEGKLVVILVVKLEVKLDIKFDVIIFLVGLRVQQAVLK